jgi:nucleotide-binding universal stress UspA family protein
MFKHLLVPLDGSPLAEAVLPTVSYLSRALGATVTLVHVIERDAQPQIHGERHLTEPAEAIVYLDAVATRMFPADQQSRVKRHVHTSEVGNVARSIVEHVDELTPDLIVMCTHGSGGLRDWIFGSIAQQVVALGVTPVLLIQPEREDADAEVAYRHIVAPIDGDPGHEQGLPVAADLAAACNATLHLIMVVPTWDTLSGPRAATRRLLPSATVAILRVAQEAAEDYLQTKVEQLRSRGVQATMAVARGDAALVVADAAAELCADVIVMGTHGKSALDAFWSGSTPPRLADRTRISLLLVPIQ